LVEGERVGDDGATVYTGRNRANKLVHFRAADGGIDHGELAEVLITRTTPWSLQGAATITAATPA
jgi:hypothetical protein